MNKYLIIKCGGSIVSKLNDDFYQIIKNIPKKTSYKPIIVHGGGKKISNMLKKEGIKPKFKHNLRVTNYKTLTITEMVLNGLINKRIVTKLEENGGQALGLSGIDNHLLMGKLINKKDFGMVGKVIKVNTKLIKKFCQLNLIPVISPISINKSYEHINVNADQTASFIASSLNGKLCFISDVPGILVQNSGHKHYLQDISLQQAQNLLKNKQINAGMSIKIKSAITALKNQVQEISIIDGNSPQNMLNYLNGKKIGTKIFSN